MSKLSRYNQDVQDVIDAMVARSKLLKGELEETFCYLKKRVRELEAENAALKKHCEWLEQNLNLKNTVVDDLKNELRDALERC